MSWTIETIGKFIESKQSNPYEFDQLIHSDPIGRLWHAVRTTEERYMQAKANRQALGTGSIFIDQAEAGRLEQVMSAALEARRRALDGLQAACVTLGDTQEPTTKAMQPKAAYLRRTRHGTEAAGIEAQIKALEAIAANCFQ